MQRALLLLTIVTFGGRPASAQAPVPVHAHRTIATTVPAAQKFFDRGLLMLYAFNVGEARTAFRAAQAADPSAALAYFGEAIAESIDINRPTTNDGEARAASALMRGRVAAVLAPPDERELLAAAELRFDRTRTQTDRLRAYFQALQAYADAHRTDGMGLTLAAYAGYNATGLFTQGVDEELTPDARTIVADLDAALALDPDDVGAHHLRIHFWEEAHRPGRALPDADYFAAATYAPGESHLQHMAGHIYDRLGNYPAMIAANVGACSNDSTYFAQGHGDGQRYMQSYHEHDVDFVLYGLTTLGKDTEARAFAAHESPHDREVTALRTHDNAGVLRLLGDAITPLRVVAEARSGELAQARADLAHVDANGDTEALIATAALARAAHDSAGAIAGYRKALAAAGSYPGDPKNHWWMPIGEGLGAVLLEANRPAEAQRVFRDELMRYPNDPRLEFGLAQALVAQGKDDAGPRAAYRESWQAQRAITLADLG